MKTSFSAAQIETLLAAVEQAWNQADLTAYAALYTEDAAYVSRSGALWMGREEIERQHRTAFAGKSPLRLRAIRSALLESEVALVHAEVQITGGGHSEQTIHAVTTFVWVIQPGGWRIAAAHTSELA